jgi:hypothetical protein
MLVPSEPHSIDPYRVSEMAIFHGTCSLGHLPGGPRERSDMRERGIRSKEPAWNRLSFGSFAATPDELSVSAFTPESHAISQLDLSPSFECDGCAR